MGTTGGGVAGADFPYIYVQQCWFYSHAAILHGGAWGLCLLAFAEPPGYFN